MNARKALAQLWQTGVDAVRGDIAVEKSLAADPIRPPDSIIAVGKAASAMAQSALKAFPGTPCLIVTKYEHAANVPQDVEVIESAHPVPDSHSLKAGAALRRAVESCAPESHLLMLVSGGASSLAEDLPDGMSLEDLTLQTQRLLASGADIHRMNAQRKEVSQIKGGKLLSRFPGKEITTLALSDVEGDVLGVIGSGIGDAPAGREFQARIIASNSIARAAIAAQQPPTDNYETLYEDLSTLAPRLGARLRDGPAGFYLWGGEPTVVLPEAPGKGGRNMALALALSREVEGLDIDILVAGTDGTDGPTDAAGAFTNGQTWVNGAADALASADAYPWLETHGCLFRPGPTGTNVMDLALAFKH